MRPFLTSSMMSEIFPTCSPSDDITLSPSSVAAAMMSGPGPSPIPPPTMSAPPRVLPCGLIEPMIHLLKKMVLFQCASSVPELSAYAMPSLRKYVLVERLDVSDLPAFDCIEGARRYQ